MSLQLHPTLTDAARARIAAGNDITFTHLRITAAADDVTVTLPIHSIWLTPLKRAVDAGTTPHLHVVTVDDGKVDYLISKIALLLQDGTTFAEGEVATITRKYAGVRFSILVDVLLPAGALSLINVKRPALLPVSSSRVEQAVEAATARIGNVPVRVNDVWHVDTCPDAALPWLAWAMSVDNWQVNWTTEQKRAVIRQSARVHRKKGTFGSVRRALDALGIPILLDEWYQTGGPPHTFRLTVPAQGAMTATGGTVLTSNFYKGLYNIIDNIKPARSHYDLRVTGYFETNTVAAGAGVQRSTYVYNAGEAKREQPAFHVDRAFGAISHQAALVYQHTAMRRVSALAATPLRTGAAIRPVVYVHCNVEV